MTIQFPPLSGSDEEIVIIFNHACTLDLLDGMTEKQSLYIHVFIMYYEILNGHRKVPDTIHSSNNIDECKDRIWYDIRPQIHLEKETSYLTIYRRYGILIWATDVYTSTLSNIDSFVMRVFSHLNTGRIPMTNCGLKVCFIVLLGLLHCCIQCRVTTVLDFLWDKNYKDSLYHIIRYAKVREVTIRQSYNAGYLPLFAFLCRQ